MNKTFVKIYEATLAGEKYKICYNIHAFTELEELGYNYEEINEKMLSKITFTDSPVLLFAGMIDKENRPSIDEIKTMMDLRTFVNLQGELQAAVMNATEIEEEPNQTKKKLQPPEK